MYRILSVLAINQSSFFLYMLQASTWKDLLFSSTLQLYIFKRMHSGWGREAIQSCRGSACVQMHAWDCCLKLMFCTRSGKVPGTKANLANVFYLMSAQVHMWFINFGLILWDLHTGDFICINLHLTTGYVIFLQQADFEICKSKCYWYHWFYPVFWRSFTIYFTEFFSYINVTTFIL